MSALIEILTLYCFVECFNACYDSSIIHLICTSRFCAYNSLSLAQDRQEVEVFVEDTKVSWIEVKVEALEGCIFDPKLSWVVMRDISSMFGGLIQSKTIINIMKPYGTMAKNNTKNGEVFRLLFEKVFNSPAIAEDGI